MTDDALLEHEAEEGMTERFKAWLRNILRQRNPDSSLKEALEEVLEEHEASGEQIPEEEQDILKNVLSFGELAVRDIMTPRTDIKAVEYNISLDELKAHIVKHIHTRIPVYNDTLDNIKGFIHIKDLVPHLASDEPFNMALILRDMLFVPPSMKLIHLLMKMRVSGVHMAIVIDEYGGTDGLVTLEDVFEEIVGDIQDEHDDDTDDMFAWSKGGYCDVKARTSIESLEKSLHLALREQEGDADYDTLGGLIFHQLGRVPEKGETMTHASGARFEIVSADPRQIHKVRIYAPLRARADTAQ